MILPVIHQRRSESIKRPAAVLILLPVVLMLTLGMVAHASSVDITLPVSVTFVIPNVSQDTTGSPNPTTISYSAYTGGTLRISLIADTSDFVRPSGAGGSIPASNILWTVGGLADPGGGTAYAGTLNSTSYTTIYEGTALANSWDTTWTLSAPGASVRAGIHSLTATWKIESL